jgi:hypothetical protein
MAIEAGTYELGERKRGNGYVRQVDPDGRSLRTAAVSKSSTSREENDRAELMRLGKIPVLKVQYIHPLQPQ